MAAEGNPYHGVLYVGLMLTPDGPRVLEYNCRFGDPETQALVSLMKGDLYAVMRSCVPGHTGELQAQAATLFDHGRLALGVDSFFLFFYVVSTLCEALLPKDNHSSSVSSSLSPPSPKPELHAINVVLASGGYPGKYAKGLPITGLTATHQLAGFPDVTVSLCGRVTLFFFFLSRQHHAQAHLIAIIPTFFRFSTPAPKSATTMPCSPTAAACLPSAPPARA